MLYKVLALLSSQELGYFRIYRERKKTHIVILSISDTLIDSTETIQSLELVQKASSLLTTCKYIKQET